jgi:hypothetical protein
MQYKGSFTLVRMSTDVFGVTECDCIESIVWKLIHSNTER